MIGVALAALVLALAPVAAAAQQCRLALSLALDVSSSVDGGEYGLQSAGLAAALTAPEVQAAFLAIPGQAVALQVFEWSGRFHQTVHQDWVMIAEAADLDQVAARLRSLPRSENSLPTAMGAAMQFGAASMENGPYCLRRTLDISGDGMNNDGIGPAQAREAPAFDLTTVNGLVIGRNGALLARYYRQFVIHGPGAFVEIAGDFDDFELAMRRKLVRELAAHQISDAPAAVPAEAASVAPHNSFCVAQYPC
jgi:hypothetical protein